MLAKVGHRAEKQTTAEMIASGSHGGWPRIPPRISGYAGKEAGHAPGPSPGGSAQGVSVPKMRRPRCQVALRGAFRAGLGPQGGDRVADLAFPGTEPG